MAARFLLANLSFLVALSGAAAAPMPKEAPDVTGLPDGATMRLGSARFKHGAAISAVAMSADGKWIATGSFDRTIRVWDAANGRVLQSYRIDAVSVLTLAFSPDGKQLAAGFGGENIQVYEWENAKEPRQLTATFPTQLAWLSGERIVYIDSTESILHCSNAKTGEEKFKIKNADFFRIGDGKTLIVASSKGVLASHNAETGEIVKPLLPEKGNAIVRDLCTTADGKLAILGLSKEGKQIIDIASGKVIQTLDKVGPLSLLPDGKHLCVGEEGVFGVYEIASGKRISEIACGRSEFPLHFSPTGDRVFVVGPGFRLRVLDTAKGQEQLMGSGHIEPIAALAMSADGTKLFTASKDSVRGWNATTGKETGFLAKPAFSLGYSAESGRIAFGSEASIQVADSLDKIARTIDLELPQVNLLQMTSDGKRIAYADGKKRLVFADPTTGQTLPPIALSGEPIALAFSPNNRQLAVMTRDGFVGFWNFSLRLGEAKANDEEGWRTRVSRNPRGAVTISPDGLLVACSSAGRVMVLSAVTGEQLFFSDRQLGEGDVHALAFSADNRMLAAGYGIPDGPVRIWELSSNTIAMTFQPKSGGVSGVRFTPDGKKLVSAHTDSTLLFWDITSAFANPEPIKFAIAWNTLDSLDTKAAYQAMGSLIREGKEAVPLIRKGLADAEAHQKQINEWIVQLGSDDFKIRKAARTALESVGLRGYPALQTARKGKLEPEILRLIELILESYDMKGWHPPENGLFGEPLRAVRSVAVLERIGGKEAIEALEELTTGKHEIRTIRDAKAALDRLKK